MSETTWESYSEQKEQTTSSSKSPSIRSLNNETSDPKVNRKNSLNKSLDRCSRIHNLSRENSHTSNKPDRWKIKRFYVFIAFLIAVLSLGVSIVSFCLYFTINKSQAMSGKCQEHKIQSTVFTIDASKLGELNSSDAKYRIPFAGPHCNFLSFNQLKRTFIANLPGTFQLTLSVALRFNDSVNKQVRLCVSYENSKDGTCSKAGSENDSMTLTLPGVVNLDVNEAFYVYMNREGRESIIKDRSLSRLVVQYSN